MAGGLIDELFVALGFKIDDKEVTNFDNNLKSTIASATRFAAAVTAAVVVVDRMATSLLKNNQAFISFNQQTGLALGNMQRIAQAGMLANMNITPETVMQSMQAVQSNLAQIRLGQGNIEPYQLLGISPVGKDANQVFDDLRQAIKGLDDMTATNIIQQMGFSPEMITVLRMSNDELKEMNGLMLSPEQRQAMEQYGSALRKVQMELGLLKDKSLLAIMPSLINFLKGFEAIAKVTFNLIDGISKFIDKLGALKGVLLVFALAVTAAFHPVIAAVTALYLILEDIAVWIMGGKSMLGTTFDIMGEKLSQIGKSISNGFMNSKGVQDIVKFYDKITNNPAQMNRQSPNQINVPPILPNPDLNNKESLIDNTTKIATGTTSANISHAQNMTQTNYMSFGSPDAVPIAQKANDLMFAMMQVDRTA